MTCWARSGPRSVDIVRQYEASFRSSHAEKSCYIAISSLPDLPNVGVSTNKSRNRRVQSFAKQWENAYRRPGFRGHLAAVIIRVVPKIGPAALLGIKIPSHETQQLYVRSINETLSHYRRRLQEAESDPPKGSGLLIAISIREQRSGRAAIARTDATYAKLLHQVVSRPQMEIPLGLREDVLAYYADPNAPITTKRDAKAWAQVQEELRNLRQCPPEQSWSSHAKKTESISLPVRVSRSRLQLSRPPERPRIWPSRLSSPCPCLSWWASPSQQSSL